MVAIDYKRVAQKSIFALASLLLVCRSAFAKTDVQIINNFLNQSGNGGKQVHDGSGNQNLTIFEPVLFFDTSPNKNTHIFGSALIDLWTSASESAFDTGTGASGQALVRNPLHAEDEEDDDGGAGSGSGTSSGTSPLQNRVDVGLGLSQKVKTWTFTPHLGYSTEYDYRSFNGSIKVDKAFAEDNFVVSGSYQLFWDQTLPYDAASSQFLGWQNKHTHSFGLSASQILSPSDLVLLGYDLTLQSGFLAGSQNTVAIGSTRVSEVLPDSRSRHSISLRYVHGFNDILAAHLDYRFYLDNWGIMAHTVEPSVWFAFKEDAGLVKLYYRFHEQSAADSYQDSFTSAKTYMTSDSDLAKLTANEIGSMASYTWDLNNHFLKSFTLNGSAIYYWRSNDLNAIIGQLGVGGTF